MGKDGSRDLAGPPVTSRARTEGLAMAVPRVLGGGLTPLRHVRERADDAPHPPLRGLAAVALGAAGLGAVVMLRQALHGPLVPAEPALWHATAVAWTVAAALGVRMRLHAIVLAALGGRPRYGLAWRTWPPLFRAYVHDHGRRYRRNQMLGVRAAALAPAAALLASAVAAPPWPWLWLAAALVAASAAPDVRAFARLLRVDRSALIEDHKDGWIAWPPAAPLTGIGRLRVVRVADLPWPRSLRRCAHRELLRRAVAASPATRFLSSSRHQATCRSASARVLRGLGAEDFAACPFHDGDWALVAKAAVALLHGEDPGPLPERDARWLASLLEDPIAWDEGSTRLDNGQHRVCALRAAGVELCVAAGLTRAGSDRAAARHGERIQGDAHPDS
jgi:hypothetical protein